MWDTFVRGVLLVCLWGVQVVGDSVLEGVPLRSTTVVAVTDCEFAVLDESDFTLVRDRGHSQMSLDDKCHFLK